VPNPGEPSVPQSTRQTQDPAAEPEGTTRTAGTLPFFDPLIGAQLGEYRVKERIGAGGMGLVYRGEQPLIGKPVAIKVLKPEAIHNPRYVERLLAEARAVNAIRHRGIIDIFSFGQTPDGRQYFVMELLDGSSLDTYIDDRGALPPQEALGMFEEILAALSAAHDAGVIHRDLKPSNIFLVKQASGGPYVKVLDFGMAKQGGGSTGSGSRAPEELIMGTPAYMAPEQIRSEDVSSKTDLYAFGVLAFEVLTGQLPFTANSSGELLILKLQHAPPSPLEHQPTLNPALAQLVVRLMARNPAERPSMADVRGELKRLARALRQEVTAMAAVPSGARLAVLRPTPRPPKRKPATEKLSSSELEKEREWGALRPPRELKLSTEKVFPSELEERARLQPPPETLVRTDKVSTAGLEEEGGVAEEAEKAEGPREEAPLPPPQGGMVRTDKVSTAEIAQGLSRLRPLLFVVGGGVAVVGLGGLLLLGLLKMKSSSDPEGAGPPEAPAQAAAPANRKGETAPPRKQKEEKALLLDRIGRLEHALKSTVPPDSQPGARIQLERLRARARVSSSASERQSVSEGLDLWERHFVTR
jgi:serine/threonine-protein kinase